jgi:hypothetical protein
MTNLIWHRDQQSDVTRKGDLAYKCWHSSGHGKVYLPADIAPDSIFLSDSIRQPEGSQRKGSAHEHKRPQNKL